MDEASVVRRFLAAVITVAIGWAVTSVAAMTYGLPLNWPDYLHTNYGFPLTFATHTLDTFAGPVDKWTVDLGALSVDLSFWFLGMVTIMVVSAYLQSRIRTGQV